MIEEHLKAIRDREKGAKERIHETRSKVEEILEREREAGEKGVEEVRVEAADLERSLLSGARRSADEKITALRADNAKRIAALSVVAKKSKGKAIDVIAEAFRKGV